MSRQSSIAIFSMKITMNFLFFASLLCSCLTTTKAYTLNNNNNPTSRREWMVKTFATPLATVVVVGTTTALPQPANAVISSKYCAYGTGEGCDDLAEGNEFIKQLQAKSAANKETIQAEARNAYYMKNYPDWFASVGKTMVKKSDGTFMVVDDIELQQLKSAGKIDVEVASAMGGKTRDLTQKPILVLKE